MNKKINAVAAICMCVFFLVYGLATGILCIIRNGWYGILDLFIITVLCGVVCLILSVAFTGAFKKRSRRSTKGLHKKSKEEKDPDKSDKNKNFLCGLAVLGITATCAAVLFGFGISFAVNMHGDKYVKTAAEIVIENGDVFYSYFANGSTLLKSADMNFYGVYILAGKSVTLYYYVFDPLTTRTAADVVMFFMGGSMFLSVGLLAFFGNTKKSELMPIFAGIAFLSFGLLPTIALQLTYGFSFFELMTSGVCVYALTIFTTFGLYFLLNVVCQLIKRIFQRRKA